MNQQPKNSMFNTNPNRINKTLLHSIMKEYVIEQGLNFDTFMSSCRLNQYARIRNYAMTILYFSDYSMQDIAYSFNRSNHTTVINSIKRTLGEIKYYEDAKRAFYELRERLFPIYVSERYYYNLGRERSQDHFVLWSKEELEKREKLNETA